MRTRTAAQEPRGGTQRTLSCPSAGSQDRDYLVRVSHLEIYMEEIRDLLAKDPKARLELRESPERGVHVRGLREFVVKSAAEMAAVLQVRRLGTLYAAPRLACLSLAWREAKEACRNPESQMWGPRGWSHCT